MRAVLLVLLGAYCVSAFMLDHGSDCGVTLADGVTVMPKYDTCAANQPDNLLKYCRDVSAVGATAPVYKCTECRESADCGRGEYCASEAFHDPDNNVDLKVGMCAGFNLPKGKVCDKTLTGQWGGGYLRKGGDMSNSLLWCGRFARWNETTFEAIGTPQWEGVCIEGICEECSVMDDTTIGNAKMCASRYGGAGGIEEWYTSQADFTSYGINKNVLSQSMVAFLCFFLMFAVLWTIIACRMCMRSAPAAAAPKAGSSKAAPVKGKKSSKKKVQESSEEQSSA